MKLPSAHCILKSPPTAAVSGGDDFSSEVLRRHDPGIVPFRQCVYRGTLHGSHPGAIHVHDRYPGPLPEHRFTPNSVQPNDKVSRRASRLEAKSSTATATPGFDHDTRAHMGLGRRVRGYIGASTVPRRLVLLKQPCQAGCCAVITSAHLRNNQIPTSAIERLANYDGDVGCTRYNEDPATVYRSSIIAVRPENNTYRHQCECNLCRVSTDRQLDATDVGKRQCGSSFRLDGEGRAAGKCAVVRTTSCPLTIMTTAESKADIVSVASSSRVLSGVCNGRLQDMSTYMTRYYTSGDLVNCNTTTTNHFDDDNNSDGGDVIV